MSDVGKVEWMLDMSDEGRMSVGLVLGDSGRDRVYHGKVVADVCI